MNSPTKIKEFISIAPDDKKNQIIGFFDELTGNYRSLVNSISKEIENGFAPNETLQLKLNKATKAIVEKGYSLVSSIENSKLVNLIKLDNEKSFGKTSRISG